MVNVRQSYTAALDASPVVALEAVRRLDLTAPATRAFRALDVSDRIALLPARLGPPSVNSTSLGLIWRIDGSSRAERITPDGFAGFRSPGHVKVQWSVGVTPSESGAFLSIGTRFTATDARSRDRLLDAWSVVAPVSKALVEGAVRRIKAYSDELEEELA
jgi:hypothetical protein